MTLIKIASQGVIKGISVPLGRFCDEDPQCTASFVDAYIGIPFAQPPLGNLRWKRPQRPAPSWQGIRESAWQRDPIQEVTVMEFLSRPRRDVERDPDGQSTLGEDCLYLNIWVPHHRKQNENLPVLVWVYGGAFIFGCASQPWFDGARLSNETNCIVVSVTYRVGPFGWMGSRELAKRTGNKGTGNYGAWDVIAALEWVQENISSFGGEASNVTIFGESAGSILIHALILSPETPAGLFSRAIMESGTLLTKPGRSMPSAQAVFDTIVTQLGASPSSSDEEKVDIMCKASAETLFALASKLPAKRPRSEYDFDEINNGKATMRMDRDQDTLRLEAQHVYNPMWDGVFLPADSLEMTRNGLPLKMNNAQKGILVGHCVDEGSVFNLAVQSKKALELHISGYNPSLRQLIKELYAVDTVETSDEAIATINAYIGDELFHVPIRELMLRLANQTQIPAYGFLFAHRPSRQSLQSQVSSESTIDLIVKLGVLHTSEIPFVFGNDGAEQHVYEREDYPGKEPLSRKETQVGFTVEEQKASLYLMRSFGKFARQESPWIRLNNGTPVDNVEDCKLLTIGRFASIGSHTPKARAAAQNNNLAIPIIEQRLGDHVAWSEKVGACASNKERHAFWAKDDFEHILTQFYGDNKMKFIP